MPRHKNPFNSTLTVWRSTSSDDMAKRKKTLVRAGAQYSAKTWNPWNNLFAHKPTRETRCESEKQPRSAREGELGKWMLAQKWISSLPSHSTLATVSSDVSPIALRRAFTTNRLMEYSHKSVAQLQLRTRESSRTNWQTRRVSPCFSLRRRGVPRHLGY